MLRLAHRHHAGGGGVVVAAVADGDHDLIQIPTLATATPQEGQDPQSEEARESDRGDVAGAVHAVGHRHVHAAQTAALLLSGEATPHHQPDSDGVPPAAEHVLHVAAWLVAAVEVARQKFYEPAAAERHAA